jgi:uracil-DNA glycosylase
LGGEWALIFMQQIVSSEIQTQAIELLHVRINQCLVCSDVVSGLTKPAAMNRGDIGRIMIVGQAPGNKELKTQEAFSGQSGRRLNEWLVKSGANADNPRKGIYLTAVVKCSAPPSSFSILAHNCRRFLNEQLRIIQPRLVITLGKEAYEELRFDVEIPFASALCREFHSKDTMFTTPVGFHYTILPWPHPSGRNRWHNDPVNTALLSKSFIAVKHHLTTI